MVYSYVQVLVPALALAAPALAPRGGRVVVAGLLMAQALWNMTRVLLHAPGSMHIGILQPNLSFLILLLFWLIYAVRGGGSPQAPEGPESPARRRPAAQALAS